MRCLVREPRRLGPERVRVQIALGDLADPSSFRNAMRGIDTVVHLAASIRDQQRASIEELNGVATHRLLRAAEREGAKRFIFFSAMGASLHSRSRFLRAKAIAEEAVDTSELEAAVVAPSLVYAPGDPWLTLLQRLSWLPAMPVPGGGEAAYQPIWAGDVADCTLKLVEEADRPGHRRYELAGPETLTHDQIVATALRSFGRRRRLAHLPLAAIRPGLGAIERLAKGSAFATYDEAELLEVPMTSERGPAGAEELGVRPRRMREVLPPA